jgi:hypothetical protein
MRYAREDGVGSMEAIFRGCCYCYLMLAFVFGSICSAPQSAAEPAVTVFPGLEIHQGGAACTVGFVEPQLRVAVTSGRCGDGSVVTDGNGSVVGKVVMAHRNTPDASTPRDGGILPVEYEVIGLAADVTPADVLLDGRQLQSRPDVSAQSGMPVCQWAKATGQTCGRIGSIGNGRFAIDGMTTDENRSGGPVYVLTDDNRAVIVGLLNETGTPTPQAESWQAVMKQLYIDTHAASPQAPAPVVRIAGVHTRIAG